MATSSQVSQKKRGRDEYLNSGLPSPDAKRTNNRKLGPDNDLMALLDKIDNMDNNEETDAVKINEVIKSLEDEIGLKAQTDNDFETTDEKDSTGQMGSDKQGELTADANYEAISVTSGFTYYDDVRADLDFFVDEITTDAVHGYVENKEVSYGFLWEDDVLLPNEHPVIQNDFASPKQDEFGISTGAEFYDIWN